MAKPDNLINLQLGWPSPRLFASSGLLQGAQDVLTCPNDVASALVYGPHVGHPPLRESIANWLSSVYSSTSPTHSQTIAITNGASANLSNLLLKFADPLYTRRIFMVEPTYFLACPIFHDNGFQGKLRGVPEGGDGIDIEFLEEQLLLSDSKEQQEEDGEQGTKKQLKTGPAYPKLYRYIIYAVPTFSNPSGRTMSLDVRRRLVKLARRFDALLVTDDVYDFLSWPAAAGGGEEGEGGKTSTETVPPPPRLVDIDRQMMEEEGDQEGWGHAVSNGSFSKIIGPGIRVGWADCPTAKFAKELGEVGSSSSGGAPSHVTSTFVDKMLRSGRLQDHIQEVLVPEYRSRYQTLMKSYEESLKPLGVSLESNFGDEEGGTGAGGFFVYVRLPDDLPSAKTVAAVALDKVKLRVAFGHMFTVAGDEGSLTRAEEVNGFSRCVRLCWAWHESAEIQEGMRRFARTIEIVRDMVKAGESFEAYGQIGIR